jgi:hypothetical protein
VTQAIKLPPPEAHPGAAKPEKEPDNGREQQNEQPQAGKGVPAAAAAAAGAGAGVGAMGSDKVQVKPNVGSETAQEKDEDANKDADKGAGRVDVGDVGWRLRRFEAVVALRKMLTVDLPGYTIDMVIGCGLVPVLVALLDCAEDNMQIEAAWVLTNLAVGTSQQCQVLLDADIMPRLVRLLQVRAAPDGDYKLAVKEQTLWLIGNLAGDSLELRGQLLRGGVLRAVLPLLHPDFWLLASPSLASPSLQRNLMWVISNFTRGKPSPHWHMVSGALPLLGPVLQNTHDAEALEECVRCYAQLSDDSDLGNPRIQAVVEQPGVVVKLVQLLGHPSSSVQSSALRACANVTTGNDDQTQAVLDAGLLPALAILLGHDTISIRKEALWCLSNIAAGSRSQIQMLIECGVLPRCVGVVNGRQDGKEVKDGYQRMAVEKEAAWVLSNIGHGGSAEQRRHLEDLGASMALVALIKRAHDTPDTIKICLEALEHLLRGAADDANRRLQELVARNGWAILTDEGKRAFAEARRQPEYQNAVVRTLEESDAVEILVDLRTSDSVEIAQRATRLTQAYWQIDDVDPGTPLSSEASDDDDDAAGNHADAAAAAAERAQAQVDNHNAPIRELHAEALDAESESDSSDHDKPASNANPPPPHTQ